MNNLGGTNFAINNSVAYPAVILVKTAVKADLKLYTRLPYLDKSLVNDLQVGVDGLLTEDMLPRAGGSDHLLGVLVGGGADADGVDIWVFDEGVVVVVGLATVGEGAAFGKHA